MAVSEFGDNNLLLVDEGHRGLGSEEETGWLKRREAISARGFVFEYSATFAQAVAAAGSESITQAYAKSVLFDYSYRYFYEDGFGKDYSILNLAKEGINVGDAKGLADHIGEQIPAEKVEVVDSEFDDRPLFAGASDSQSPVNILIGAKKFSRAPDQSAPGCNRACSGTT